MLCAPVAKLILLYERGLAGRGSVLAALDNEREAQRRATLAFEQTEVALAISQRLQLASALGAAIAHRIDDALTVVRCWAEALRAGAPDTQERKLASSAITVAARRLSLLTRKLMSIALPARGGRDVTDVRRCFDELAPLCKQVLRADVHLDILLEGALYVRLGEAQLEQVLLNLVLNAADAMPAGGRLEIAAALDREGRIVLRVSDTGQFRGGLGLAPVQKIVTAAGGRIDVRSGVGSGTAVTVSLPSAESAGAVEGWSGRVLLVEREDDVRRLAADALRKRGFAVLDEPNVARALDRVRRLRARLDLLCIGCSVSADGLAALVDELFALHAGARVLVCDRLELAAALRPFMTGRRIALMPEPFAATDLAERAYTLIEAEPAPGSEAT
jgi:CheY-like chemotaxis protein